MKEKKTIILKLTCNYKKNDLFIIGVPKLKDQACVFNFLKAYAKVCEYQDLDKKSITFIKQIEIVNKKTTIKRYSSPKLKNSLFDAQRKDKFGKILLEQIIISNAESNNLDLGIDENANTNAIILAFNPMTLKQ